jgi:hypothetical protein
MSQTAALLEPAIAALLSAAHISAAQRAKGRRMTPNRFVLVDDTGRVYDRTGVSVEISDQDDGLTLKVFVTPLPADEHSRANATHCTRLAQSLNQCRKAGDTP